MTITLDNEDDGIIEYSYTIPADLLQGESPVNITGWLAGIRENVRVTLGSIGSFSVGTPITPITPDNSDRPFLGYYEYGTNRLINLTATNYAMRLLQENHKEEFNEIPQEILKELHAELTKELFKRISNGNEPMISE